MEQRENQGAEAKIFKQDPIQKADMSAMLREGGMFIDCGTDFDKFQCVLMIFERVYHFLSI